MYIKITNLHESAKFNVKLDKNFSCSQLRMKKLLLLLYSANNFICFTFTYMHILESSDSSYGFSTNLTMPTFYTRHNATLLPGT